MSGTTTVVQRKLLLQAVCIVDGIERIAACRARHTDAWDSEGVCWSHHVLDLVADGAARLEALGEVHRVLVLRGPAETMGPKGRQWVQNQHGFLGIVWFPLLVFS